VPKSELEKGLLESLEASIEYAKGTRTARTSVVALAPPAPHFSKKEIVSIRKGLFGVSQRIFASYLNVSSKTVKAWEQGLRRPDSTALRLLQLFAKDPRKLREKILSYR
jgi:putative transcriptional regulator